MSNTILLRKPIRRKGTNTAHRMLKHHCSDSAVQQRHRTHSARLVTEVDVEVMAQVASDVIFPVVILLAGSRGEAVGAGVAGGGTTAG